MKTQTICPGGYESGVCQGSLFYVSRVQSVNNNQGYQLKLQYASNSTLLDASNVDDWGRITSVTAINNAVEYCNPSADSCSLSGSWPTALYTKTTDMSGNTVATVTDPASRTTTYTAGTGTFRVKRPGAASDNRVYSITSGKVSSAAIDGVTYNYAYSDSGTTRTTTVTDPNSNSQVYVSDLTTSLVSSFRDELLHTSSYTYDTSGRVKTITAPETNQIQYTYDTRGNITEVRQVAKTGSGLSDIVSSAVYPSSCTTPANCNKPTSTTDPRLKTTDYTWDSAHGGILTVTAPAPTTGATRPQTRYSYQTYNAYFKWSSGGSPSASGSPIYQLVATSSCQTLSSCSGGVADEQKVTIGYGPQVAGTANNLLPVSISSGAGDSSLTATTGITYDSIGNATYVDGPLSGTADTTRRIFDADREVVGVIGPDPDGGGSLKNRAQRITYNSIGQVTKAEQGTTLGQTDANWTAFSALWAVDSGYDTNARLITQSQSSGSTTYTLNQFSYDSLGRLDCSAVRMNSAVFASLPASACSLGTAGSFGQDRITKITYDGASRRTKITSGYGVAGVQADIVNAAYDTNDVVTSLSDANNNKTTYQIDGFGRPYITYYPSPTTSGTSSSTDYEQLTYDAGSNVTIRRLRDGSSIAYTFDALNRVTLKDLPGSELDVNYGYDLLSRLTATSTTAQSLTFTYDALNRNLNQSGPLGTMQSMWDLAGRRIRLTWPDTAYIVYDRMVTGEVSAIRENGAASGVGVLATYGYNDLGRRSSTTRGNSTSTIYGYDAISRLNSLSHDLYSTPWDVTWSLSYNPASQLSSVTRSNEGYAYSSAAAGSRTATTNGLNQATALGSMGLGYDAKGNITSIGSNAYTYSSENLLLSGPGATLSYDPMTRLYRESGPPAARMQYDGLARVAEYDDAGTLVRRFVPGPDADEVATWYEGSGVSDRRWLYNDERGSPVIVADSTSFAIAVNSFDPYGVPLAGNMGRAQYTGQMAMPELGLYYYKSRAYAPTLGRFMQPDPVGYKSGMNLYAYVAGDPINLSDPLGLRDQFIIDREHSPSQSGGPGVRSDGQGGIIVEAGNRPVDYSVCNACNGPGPVSRDIFANFASFSSNIESEGQGAPASEASQSQDNRGCIHRNSAAAAVAKVADSISTGAGLAAGASAGLGLALAPTGAGLVGFEAFALTAATVSTIAAGVGLVANAIDGNYESAGWDVAGVVGGAAIGRVATNAFQSTRAFGDLSAGQARAVKFIGYGTGNAVGSSQALLGCQ